MKPKQALLTFAALVAVLFVVPVVPVDSADVQPVALSDIELGEAEVLYAEPAVVGCCCNAPCIKYKQHGRCRSVCCGCEPPINTVLTVEDPRCCSCAVEVPICLPGCCTDVPCVKSRTGLFCRGVVTYEWCCGYKVKVVIKKSGDMVVISKRFS